MFLFDRVIPATISLLLLCILLPVNATANRTLGLYYPESSAERITRGELEWLAESGITWLMVEEKLSTSHQVMIREAGFSLYVMVPEYYPIPTRLTDDTYGYAQRSDSLMSRYQHNPSVKGFGLFAYGEWQSNTIPDKLENLAAPYVDNRLLFTLDPRPLSGSDLHPFDGTVLLTRSADALEIQLEHNPELCGILYTPQKRSVDIRDLQRVFEIMEDSRELPIFFHRNWFLRNSARDTTSSQVSNKTDISQITAFYYNMPDARIANPAPDSSGNELDFSIFLLFLLWAVYTAYYRLNPFYRKSLTRYFLNHDFFVNDVLMRRIRMSGDTVILFILSSFLAGLMAFATAQSFLDSVAMGALLHYIPLIPANWTHPSFFFLFFFLQTAAVNAILIAWLRIANTGHARTNQIATLLLWPQHLNIIIISVGVIFLRSYHSEIIVVSMFLLFWTVTLISFLLTAYNMRRVHPTSALYMISTYALFILVTTGFVSWLIFGMELITAWNLAASLALF